MGQNLCHLGGDEHAELPAILAVNTRRIKCFDPCLDDLRWDIGVTETSVHEWVILAALTHAISYHHVFVGIWPVTCRNSKDPPSWPILDSLDKNFSWLAKISQIDSIPVSQKKTVSP